ncbi:MAG: pentapeptide repeat-containing protein [Pseudomonadota bacterium]
MEQPPVKATPAQEATLEEIIAKFNTQSKSSDPRDKYIEYAVLCRELLDRKKSKLIDRSKYITEIKKAHDTLPKPIDIDLSDADLSKATFWNQSFTGANTSLQSANCRGAIFHSCYFTDNVNCQGADFSCARIEGEALQKYNENTSYNEKTPPRFQNCDLSGAIFDNVTFRGDILFDKCQASKAQFNEITFNGKMRFKDCDLPQATLSYKDFKGAISFFKCNLIHYVIKGQFDANNMSITFDDCTLTQADFSGLLPDYKAKTTKHDNNKPIKITNCCTIGTTGLRIAKKSLVAKAVNIFKDPLKNPLKNHRNIKIHHHIIKTVDDLLSSGELTETSLKWAKDIISMYKDNSDNCEQSIFTRADLDEISSFIRNHPNHTAEDEVDYMATPRTPTGTRGSYDHQSPSTPFAQAVVAKRENEKGPSSQAV